MSTALPGTAAHMTIIIPQYILMILYRLIYRRVWWLLFYCDINRITSSCRFMRCTRSNPTRQCVPRRCSSRRCSGGNRRSCLCTATNVPRLELTKIEKKSRVYVGTYIIVALDSRAREKKKPQVRNNRNSTRHECPCRLPSTRPRYNLYIPAV